MKVPSLVANVDLAHDTGVVKGDSGRAPGTLLVVRRPLGIEPIAAGARVPDRFCQVGDRIVVPGAKWARFRRRPRFLARNPLARALQVGTA